jgi:hypothetical protein
MVTDWRGNCKKCRVPLWENKKNWLMMVNNKYWLVVDLPLWKIWWSESQLGWWHSQHDGKVINIFQSTNQKIHRWWSVPEGFRVPWGWPSAIQWCHFVCFFSKKNRSLWKSSRKSLRVWPQYATIQKKMKRGTSWNHGMTSGHIGNPHESWQPWHECSLATN